MTDFLLIALGAVANLAVSLFLACISWRRGYMAGFHAGLALGYRQAGESADSIAWPKPAGAWDEWQELGIGRPL